MTTQTQLIYHQSPAAVFAFRALRVIDQSGLDPFERTALLHFCAVAGTPENPVEESLRVSAGHCNMSVGKFHGVRLSLAQKGWITLEDGIISITDKWDDAACSPHEQPPAETAPQLIPVAPETVHHMNATPSTNVHPMNTEPKNPPKDVDVKDVNTYNVRSFVRPSATTNERTVSEIVQAFEAINRVLVRANKQPLSNLRGMALRIAGRGETAEEVRSTYRAILDTKTCANKVGAFVKWCWDGSTGYLHVYSKPQNQQALSIY